MQNNYFSFNVLYAGNIIKCPFTLQLLVKWEVVSPNSRYREFYHEIGNIGKFPFTYWLNGRWFLQIIDIHVGNFYMKLTGRWFPQIVQWESISNIYITQIVVLVSEPVRGRSRATELPCYILCFYCMEIENKYISINVFNIFMLYFSV